MFENTGGRRQSNLVHKFISPAPAYITYVDILSSHVKFSQNSKFVLAATQDSTIRLWNYHSSRCVKTYTGHMNRTYCIVPCFTHTKSKYIVSGSEDAKIFIWDLQSRKVVQVLEGHRGKLSFV